jgi:hypothetical protein
MAEIIAAAGFYIGASFVFLGHELSISSVGAGG